MSGKSLVLRTQDGTWRRHLKVHKTLFNILKSHIKGTLCHRVPTQFLMILSQHTSSPCKWSAWNEQVAWYKKHMHIYYAFKMSEECFEIDNFLNIRKCLWVIFHLQMSNQILEHFIYHIKKTSFPFKISCFQFKLKCIFHQLVI